jgi:hypothetical protein
MYTPTVGKLRTLLAAAVLLSLGPTASAQRAVKFVEEEEPKQDRDGEDGQARRTELRWYGYQVLALDLAVAAVMVAGLKADTSTDADDVLKVLFVVGALVGGPIVHGANGENRGALYSAGLRVAAVLAAGALHVNRVACEIEHEPESRNDCLPAWAPLVPLVAATVIDAGLIAFKRRVVPPPIAPAVVFDDRFVGLGVAGSF